MQWRLFRMGIEGKVAVANLTLVGCALLVLANGNAGSAAWCTAWQVARVGFAILSCPVGWLSMPGETLDGPPIDLILYGIFLPLNAYLWGYVVAAVLAWRGNCRTSSQKRRVS